MVACPRASQQPGPDSLPASRQPHRCLRLLDVSDPAIIVELDQFATENVFANPPLPGDRTMHNVVVDGGTTAYISWYAEGMRVVDFSDDELTEIAHFVDTTDGSNFWGVYLPDHPTATRTSSGRTA